MIREKGVHGGVGFHTPMGYRMIGIAEKFWPGLKTMEGQRRLVGVGEVITFLYSAPLALAGFAWLVSVTDLEAAWRNWSMLVFLAILMLIFRRLGFFLIAEIREGRYASSDGSLESMVLWTAVFLYGPTALWLAVFWSVFELAFRWRANLPAVDRWSRARNFTLYLAGTLLATLTALYFYRLLGGSIPLKGLAPQYLLPATVALIAHFVVTLAVWSGYLALSVWVQLNLASSRSIRPVLRFFLAALGLPALAHPFAILAAGLYNENGVITFLFFIAGMIVVALMTRQLSWAAESRRQQSRQLEKLEALGRAIINAPPDSYSLPLLLREHIPGMFPSGRILAWVQPDDILLNYPLDWQADIQALWTWLGQRKEAAAFLSRDSLPWQAQPADHNAVVIAPILNVDSNEPMGGIYLELFSLAQPWDRRSLRNLFPAVLSLAAQAASALHQTELYSQALDYQRVTQELSLAGKIQASFLPDELPSLSGWQLAVTLLPARETSGDFFDLIPLENGKLGILIADVTDKGVGAALYMALSRTLIRTYAIEFGDDPQPDVVFFAANGRILKDARANLFVTAFYGILDPVSGELTYCNAGHNPPYLLQGGDHLRIQALGGTGMPIGIEEDNLWEKATVQIQPGEILVLYTDGIPDAQNEQGEFFEDRLLQKTVLECPGLSAQEVQERILEHVQNFVGPAPQFDDITLLILVRDPEV
jgi:serine phosphatase RsbU (regulator of sigma subunit)